MNSGRLSHPERQNQTQAVVNSPQSPKLLAQVRNKMRLLHHSIRKESAYVDWIVRFPRFHRTADGTWQHPSSPGGPHISEFLTHLAVGRHVSASTQNQALCALLFLYRQVLELDPGRLDGVRAKGRDGEGEKDRVVPFPERCLEPIRQQIEGLANCIRVISLRDMVPCGCLTRLQKSIRRRLVSFSGSLYFRQVESARILGQERFAGTTCMRIPFRSLCELLCFVRALTKRSVVVVKPGSIGVKPAGVR
jgi:hypothetical protein